MKINLRSAVGILLIAALYAIYAILPFVHTASVINGFIRMMVLFFVLVIVICAFFKVMPNVLVKLHSPKIEKIIYDSWTNGRFVFTLWIILLICWLPTYLAFFPGIFGYDAPNQMQQLLGEIPLSAHHPIFHTAILGRIMEFGKYIFGNYNGGVALFCILQGILVTGSIAYTFLYMKIKRVPLCIFILTFIGCACNPVIQMLSFNTTKDILFGVVFLHFVICCYEWISKDTLKTKVDILRLILWGSMTCLLRNQGKYIVLVLLLFCIFIYRTDKKFLFSLGTIVIICQLFFTISTSVFGVTKSDTREMLSIPMQQMAFVCTQYIQQGDVNLTQEEFEKFTLLIKEENLYSYTPDISDPIKMYFNTNVLKQDVLGYFKLYLTVGLRNPGEYLTAMCNMIYPYWDMSRNQFRHVCVENTFGHMLTEWGIEQKSLLPQYKKFLSNYLTNTMGEKNSLISCFFQPGICIWIMTVLFGIAIIQNDKAIFIGTLILFLFFGTLLLGPVALLRYIYPLMLTMPWMVALLCDCLEGKNKMFV